MSQADSPTITIRAFTTADLPAFVKLYNQQHPEPKSKHVLHHFLSTIASDTKLSAVLTYKHQPKAFVYAYAQAPQDTDLKLIFLNTPFHKPHAQHLYTYARQKLRPSFSGFKTSVREDDETWQQFFLEQGFKELERQWVSRLDVASFEARPFLSAFSRAASAGVRFTRFSELPQTVSSQRMLYNAVVAFLQDVPTAEPLNIWPFELWQSRYFSHPYRRLESVFLAFHDEQLIGMTELIGTKNAHVMQTGLTAVSPAFRHKGIALSLKLQAIKYALACGVSEITTTNHSVNHAMLRINDAMGFKKDPAWIHLKQVFKGAHHDD